jgi:hypothetical protein
MEILWTHLNHVNRMKSGMKMKIYYQEVKKSFENRSKKFRLSYLEALDLLYTSRRIKPEVKDDCEKSGCKSEKNCN